MFVRGEWRSIGFTEKTLVETKWFIFGITYLFVQVYSFYYDVPVPGEILKSWTLTVQLKVDFYIK